MDEDQTAVEELQPDEEPQTEQGTYTVSETMVSEDILTDIYNVHLAQTGMQAFTIGLLIFILLAQIWGHR